MSQCWTVPSLFCTTLKAHAWHLNEVCSDDKPHLWRGSSRFGKTLFVQGNTEAALGSLFRACFKSHVWNERAMHFKGIVHPNLKSHPLTSHPDTTEGLLIFYKPHNHPRVLRRGKNSTQWKPVGGEDKNVTCLHPALEVLSKRLGSKFFLKRCHQHHVFRKKYPL